MWLRAMGGTLEDQLISQPKRLCKSWRAAFLERNQFLCSDSNFLHKNFLRKEKKAQGTWFMKANVSQARPFPDKLPLHGSPVTPAPRTAESGCLSLMHLN